MKTWTVTFAVSLVLSLPVGAQSRFAVTSGMGYAEVVKALGSPKERVERETKREDVWHYPRLKVTFREGRVVDLNNGAEKTTLTLVSDKQVAAPKPASPSSKVDPVALEEILTEIMSASGDEGAPGAPDLAPGGMPRTFTPPPPVEPVE